MTSAKVGTPIAFGLVLILILIAGLDGPPRASAGDGPASKSAPRTLGIVRRLDAGLDAIVPPGAVIERLAEGFEWAEGPVWDRATGSLLFSDVPTNTVHRYKDGSPVGVFLKPSGYTGVEPRGGEPGSNGLVMDPKGRLVLCQHGDRRVARLEAGKFVTLADRYDGKRFNSPNDAIYQSNGDLLFTDPPYGLLGGNADPKKELPFNGVYRLSARTGALTLLTRDLTFPNGLALSPDESTLYVANSDPARAIWMAYPVRGDGSLGEGRVFADRTAEAKTLKGLPDGLKVDSRGNLFATGPGGVLIFSAAGVHLGTLDTGEATANVGWGEDGSTLYITADMYLARIKLKSKGTGF